MTDYVVSLPQSMPPDFRATLELIALAGSFASPSHASVPQLESELLTRFSSQSTIAISDVIAWLESSGMTYQDLAPLVAQLPGNVVPLHTALQSQITAEGIVLLQVADASKLLDASITDTPTSLHPNNTNPTWLLRSGYSDSNDYGLYVDELAYGYTQPVHILWSDVLASGITAAIALNAPVPPKPPVDLESAANALHIAEQAMVTMQSAIDSFKTALQVA